MTEHGAAVVALPGPGPGAPDDLRLSHLYLQCECGWRASFGEVMSLAGLVAAHEEHITTIGEAEAGGDGEQRRG